MDYPHKLTRLTNLPMKPMVTIEVAIQMIFVYLASDTEASIWISHSFTLFSHLR